MGDQPMITGVTHITVLVENMDEALTWFEEKFDFVKRRDSTFGDGGRFLTVNPKDNPAVEVVLQQPFNNEGRSQIGQGTMWVFAVDDCRKTTEELRARGVTIVSEPEDLPWGVSSLIKDISNNSINLVEATIA